jgi:hypothetical protein
MLLRDCWHARVYDQLMTRAKLRGLKKPTRSDENYVYYEKHHVLPKSMGRSNDADNLVLLTAREHFIAHMLLPRMCVEKTHRQNLNCALRRMTTESRNSSNSYAREKIRITKEGMSDIARLKMSISKLGRKIGPPSIETREKISLTKLGSSHSEASRLKMSLARKGKKFGPMSDQAKSNISNGKLKKASKESLFLY